MNWHSETAALWLPKGHDAYPEDFETRAAPGSNDLFYYAIDAFASIYERQNAEVDREPWAYIIDEKRMLWPSEIRALRPEWEVEMKLALQMQTIPAE